MFLVIWPKITNYSRFNISGRHTLRVSSQLSDGIALVAPQP